MRTPIRFLMTTLYAFLLIISVAHAQSHDHEHAVGKQAEVAQAVMSEGVQVVEIKVSKMAFSVKAISLEAGVPARLIFTRTEEGGCTHKVQVPAFGIEATDLPLNEPVAIEFTPTEEGTFTFACGMNMIQGSILVKT